MTKIYEFPSPRIRPRTQVKPSTAFAGQGLDAASVLVTFGALRTYSPKMQRLLETLQPLADSELSLLIEGETGVGKEVVAENVHRFSARRDSAFVVFDCAAK